jgi:ATPase
MELVPDTSVVVDGRLSEGVEDGEFAGATIVVPEAVVGELEAQANDGRETGWEGLAELRALVELEAAGEATVEYVGRRPEAIEKRDAGEGEIDALIRDLAADRGATLVTSDDVQAEVADERVDLALACLPLLYGFGPWSNSRLRARPLSSTWAAGPRP